MSKIKSHWEVEPHDSLVELDDGLLTVAGDIHMPLGNFPRRMTVIRLASGGTAIWSAMALRDEEMRRIEMMGTPEWLIVPGVQHRLDARIWKARYPEMRVLCAPKAREKVEEAVRVDAVVDPFSDPEVTFEAVPGMGELEGVLFVRRNNAITLVVNDLVANVRHPHGIGAQLMARIFGFGVHGPQVPRIVHRMAIEDDAEVAAAMRRWAKIPGLARLVPSHGEIIDSPRDVLLELANELDGAAETKRRVA